MHQTGRAFAKMTGVFRTLLLFAFSLFGLMPATSAAAYPERPINLIIAFAPGGGTDIVARAMAPYIEKYLGDGARIVVYNRPGAGGAIGFGAIASAAPDGYTIGFLNTANLLAIPIERKAAFTWESFDLLGNIVDDPTSFVVHADSPYKTVADLVAYAKANPGAVSVGTTGTGSAAHLAMMFFEKGAGVKLNHIPYKGGADVHNGLASKQIVVGGMSIGEALQYTKAGTPLRVLGQMSVKRTVLAPNIPTFREQGSDIVMASLRGIAAPKGLPPEIRERLVKAIERAANDPEFQAKAVTYFAPLRYLPPPAYAAELREGEAQLRQLWKEMPWLEK